MSKVDFLVLSKVRVNSKNEAIEALVQELDQRGYLSDKEQFYADVLEREATFPTYIGNEIGLPHSQSTGVKKPCIIIGKLEKNIVWTDEDEKADLVFLIAVPKDNKDNLHLKILSKLARMLMHDDFRNSIRTLGESELLNLLYTNMEEEVINEKNS